MPEGSALEEIEWSDEVARRLRDGDFRLIIAVDRVNDDLRRMVNFINTKAAASAGLRLVAVEFPRYQRDATQVIVPQTYGDEQRKPDRPPTGLEEAHREFWTQLAEYLSAHGVDHLPNLATQAIARVRYPVRGLRLRPWRVLKGQAGVSLEADGPDGEAAFDVLRQHRSALEQALGHLHHSANEGEPIRWGPPDYAFSYLAVDWGGDASERANWIALDAWFGDVLSVMFGPVLDIANTASMEADARETSTT
jgi:hypothetical protein